MKRLEKIINLTTRIYELYIDIFYMEIYDLTNTPDYLEKLEILKLYKEYEDRYYKELNSKNNKEELAKLQKNLNVDNTVEEQLSDINFSNYIFDNKSNNEMIIKRRIYSKLGNLVMQNMTNDELINLCKEMSNHLRINMVKKSLHVGCKQIFILDKANILKDIILRVADTIVLRYMYFYILNRRDYISTNKKYIISFINESIEEKLINFNFEVASDFLKRTKYVEDSKINQEIFEDILFEHSCEIFDVAVDEFLSLENISSEENKEIMLILKAIIQTTGIEIDEDIKNFIMFTRDNQNIMDENKKIIKKELTRIITETEEDKKYL